MNLTAAMPKKSKGDQELLLQPSEEEILHLAKNPEINLPEIEARKFFCHYSLTGWKYGKGKHVITLQNIRIAMQGWKLRWLERGGFYQNGQMPQSPLDRPLSDVDKRILGSELQRCLEEMRRIRNSYSENQDWSRKDHDAWKKAKARRDEIKAKLGIQF